MATVLGVNAASHDPAAAPEANGRIAAATEDERFTRRKHGKHGVLFSTWEVPEPLVHRLLEDFGRRTGVPVLVNASLNPAGSPVVDDPRTAVGRRADSIAASAASPA